MLYTCIWLNIKVLHLQPGHSYNDIVAGNISNNKIYCMAMFNTSAIAYVHHMAYKDSATQELAIDNTN